MFKGRIAAVLAVVLCLAFFSTVFGREFVGRATSGMVDMRPTVILDAGHVGFNNTIFASENCR